MGVGRAAAQRRPGSPTTTGIARPAPERHPETPKWRPATCLTFALIGHRQVRARRTHGVDRPSRRDGRAEYAPDGRERPRGQTSGQSTQQQSSCWATTSARRDHVSEPGRPGELDPRFCPPPPGRTGALTPPQPEAPSSETAPDGARQHLGSSEVLERCPNNAWSARRARAWDDAGRHRSRRADNHGPTHRAMQRRCLRAWEKRRPP